MPVSEMDTIIPLYDAMQVHQGNYDAGDTDYSVTTLLNPPRIVHLNKRHAHKVDLYIQDMLHSYTGTANHNYTEDCLNRVMDSKGNPKYQCEERLGVKIAGRKISGAYDIVWLDKLSMWDMKNTSTWKIVFGSKHEWTQQQNMYRYLYWLKHKQEIVQLNIIGMFRDWSLANMFRNGKDYPRKPVVRYKLPLWDMQRTYDFMEERVEHLKAHEQTADHELPLCSWEDMWAKEDRVAVKTDRLKKALRILDNQKTADEWLAAYLSKPQCKDRASTITFEVRRSERIRCESWCPVNLYCNQYQDYLKVLARTGS